MSNPNCDAVDSRPSPVAAGTVGLFEGAHYYHCGALPARIRLQDAQSRRAVLPDLPAGDLQSHRSARPRLAARARTPINVVARYPEHLDVFAVASDGRTMSDWWDQSSGWAGWFQVSGGVASPGGQGSPVTAIARYAGHLDLFIVGTDNRVYSCWWDQSAAGRAGSRSATLTARAGSTVNVVARDADHLDLFTTASDGRIMSTWWDARRRLGAGWFQVTRRSRRQRIDASPPSPATPCTSTCSPSGPTTRSTAAGGTRTAGWAGWFPLPGITCRPDATVTVVARNPGSARPFHHRLRRRDHVDLVERAQRLGRLVPGLGRRGSRRSQVTAIARAHSNHLDIFIVGTDNRIYCTCWDQTRRLGRLVQRLRRGRPAGQPDRGDLADHRAPRRVRGRVGRARLQHLVGRLGRLGVGLVPARGRRSGAAGTHPSHAAGRGP